MIGLGDPTNFGMWLLERSGVGISIWTVMVGLAAMMLVMGFYWSLLWIRDAIVAAFERAADRTGGGHE